MYHTIKPRFQFRPVLLFVLCVEGEQAGQKARYCRATQVNSAKNIIDLEEGVNDGGNCISFVNGLSDLMWLMID